jgi:hypothetical protein
MLAVALRVFAAASVGPSRARCPGVARGGPRRNPSGPVLPDTELSTYPLAFIRRGAQTHVGDILKIAASDYLNDEPYADP